MTKILFVSNNLGQGGKERQIHELLKYFNSRPGSKFALLLREPLIHYNLEALNMVDIFVPGKRLGAFAFAWFCFKSLRSFKPNVVHTWESGSALLALLVKKPFFPSIKVVDGTLRYSKKFPKTSKLYWVARMARQLSDKVVANSKAGLDSLDYKRDHKFMVIPNGLDFSRFVQAAEKPPGQGIVIGMVASFTKPKDYATLVASCISILQLGKNIKVILVGDGPERKAIEQSVPPHLKKHFEFTGNIPQPELKIQEFDIAVLLSKKMHSEGLSNAIMEYMATGLPVICTRTGGNTELVTDGGNGFLMAHEDQNQLREKLLELLADEALRKKMGRRSREAVANSFDIKKVAEAYSALYASI